MKKQLNSHQFDSVYKALNINVDKLGCIMLDVDGSDIEDYTQEEELYYSKDKNIFWVKGFVAGKHPHITLLYGLLKNGGVWKKHVNKVLGDWDLKTIEIEEVSFFDTPYQKEPYYCIIAKVKVTPDLEEGHQRMQFLPHIDTHSGYKPHVTIAYIKKDDKIRDRVIKVYNKMLKGKKLKITGINYGDKKP